MPSNLIIVQLHFPSLQKNVFLYCVPMRKFHPLTSSRVGKVKLWVKLHALWLRHKLISEPSKDDGILSPVPAFPSFLLFSPCAVKPPVSSSGQKGELGTGKREGHGEEGRPLLLLAGRCCNSNIMCSFGC